MPKPTSSSKRWCGVRPKNVAGFNYWLILEATDKGVTNNNEAVVWEKAWMSYRNLTSFRHV
uniref:Cystatin domain-containing protein n=1 Tax=Nelumbo nucifera TaxID=4432 RepID=A0A822ZV64_NELNU|nr:TPA_asm: hypothetical protein HUJ06_019069 [Nelumbo nucifera]